MNEEKNIPNENKENRIENKELANEKISQSGSEPQPQTSNIAPPAAADRVPPSTSEVAQGVPLAQQTTNMETHAHHLHKAPGKKWSHYFYEFLMLFLAVFCGFLAENLREHYIEHKRAKVFAASMIDDLVSDTTELKDYLKYMTYAASNVDTLSQLLLSNKPNEIPSGKLYWYGLWGGTPRVFVPNDATFQQMKSSGSLRYFTNKSVSQKVAQYDQLCREWTTFEEMDQTIYTEVRKMRAQIFEFRYNAVANAIYQSDPVSPNRKRIDSFILTNPPLLTYDKGIFNEYIELVRSRFIPRKVKSADTLLLHASTLLNELKREYHLP